MAGRFRRVLPRWFGRSDFEREMDLEIENHIEERTDDLVRRGVPRNEAVRRARAEFGPVEAVKEQCRIAAPFQESRATRGAVRIDPVGVLREDG